MYFVDNLVVLRKKIKIEKDTKYILLAAYVLIFYVYISDLIKNDPIEATNIFLPAILIPLILPIFEYKNTSLNLNKVLYYVFGLSLFIAILQIFGLGKNLSTLLPGSGPIQSDQLIDPATEAGNRVSGALFSIIGFAEYLGIFIIIAYYKYLETKKKLLIIAMVVMTIVLFFTQTRSALYGIVPSIILIQLVTSKRKVKETIKIIMLMILILSALLVFDKTIEDKFSRIKSPLEFTATHRLKVNYYMSKGVLMESPIFGISQERAWDILYQYGRGEPEVLLESSKATPTHHNQLGFYLRYYGLLGLVLLAILYFAIIKKIANSRSYIIKAMLLSIFLFDFQYSMGHNTKILNNILLWILLSFSVGESLQIIGNSRGPQKN